MNKLTRAANKILESGKENGKAVNTKPHFFSPEAKAERHDKRMALVRSHITALVENEEIMLPNSIGRLGEKKLKSAEKLFTRLSLKELELILDIFVQCEEVGQIVGEKGVVTSEKVAV